MASSPAQRRTLRSTDYLRMPFYLSMPLPLCGLYLKVPVRVRSIVSVWSKRIP